MSKVEEKYHRAAQSSHLELKRTDESPGDVDTIIAAGLAETMGILLTRLRGEWDAAGRSVDQYKRAQAEWMRLARDAAARAKQSAESAEKAKKALATAKEPDRYALHNAIEAHGIEAKRQQGEAERFTKEATREHSTAKWEILSGLRSLEPAKQSLFLFAHRQAPHKACNSDEKALADLVSRVLDVWLDRVCHECQGRGFSGGYGSARIMCRSPRLGGCGGSGSRSRRLGKLSEDPAEQVFGLFLLNVMDSRVNGSMKQVQRKTRQG